MVTRPRIPLISFCTVQLRTLCAAHSLATLYLFTTCGPDPGEFPVFWGSMVSRHAPIPQKGSGKQQQRDGVVVRASASLSVDLGFIPLVESYQKTLKDAIYSFPAWRSEFMGGVENKPASSLVVSLGKALNWTPHIYVKERWPRHLGNSNSQASADIPSKT